MRIKSEYYDFLKFSMDLILLVEHSTSILVYLFNERVSFPALRSCSKTFNLVHINTSKAAAENAIALLSFGRYDLKVKAERESKVPGERK